MQNKISDWLNSYLEDSGMFSFVVGVSGGVDSAVTSTLCARTLKKTFLVSLPIHQNESQLERAQNHCKWLEEAFPNVEFLEIDLSDVFDSFKGSFDFEDDLGFANTRSRIRMTALYQIASKNKGLVVGTGNKVEDFGVGFYTKYGDGGVDLSPIADLTKTEVRQLAKEMYVSTEIIDAAPTDGLWEDDRTDEDQIGASYEELEWAMSHSGGEVTERQSEVLKIYRHLNKKNSHKMNPIPVWKK